MDQFEILTLKEDLRRLRSSSFKERQKEIKYKMIRGKVGKVLLI